MTPTSQELPFSLQRISKVVGLGPACAVFQSYKGASLYIPKEPATDHPLRRILTPEELQALSNELGGESFNIPTSLNWGTKKLRIFELAKTGKSPREIAKELICSTGYVYKVLRTDESAETDLGRPVPLSGGLVAVIYPGSGAQILAASELIDREKDPNLRLIFTIISLRARFKASSTAPEELKSVAFIEDLPDEDLFALLSAFMVGK